MARRTTLLVVAALALAGCGGDDGPPAKPPQEVVDAGNPAQGREVFAGNCAACHGGRGEGGTGPALAGESAYTDPEAVVDQIRDGGGGMPAFGDRLSEQELADVSAFVVRELAR
jgi:mono/diheme cytochrome c family protein